MQSRGKHILFCGDCNINFVQRSGKLVELQNLLIMHNLVNTVKKPTRIMHNTSSLIDVMIVNTNLEKQTVTYDLGYSDHLAQIVYIKVGTPVPSPTAIQKRQFTDTAIEEFIYFLQQRLWNEILSMEGVNLAFNAFMTIFMHHFNAMFPIKTCPLLDKKNVKVAD